MDELSNLREKVVKFYTERSNLSDAKGKASMFYTLKGTTVVEETDAVTWAKSFGKDNRNVAKTNLPNGKTVSTVFVGLDYRFGDPGPPLVFETMVFQRYPDGQMNYEEIDMKRSSTWEEAEMVHNDMVIKHA